MKNPLVALALTAALLAGCGGSGGAASSTTETAQGAAKLWIAAAVAGNDARVRELCVDESREKCAKIAEQIREKFQPTETFRWGAGNGKGEDLAWTATAPGGVVFLQLRKAGEKEWRVSDVDPSW